MIDQPSDHDDDRDADDHPEATEFAQDEEAHGDPAWLPKISVDLSGLFPDLTDMIRRALPDMSGVVKAHVPPGVFPKIDIPSRVYPAFDLSGLIPKPDLSGLIPTPDLSGLVPVPDMSGIMPRFNFAPLAGAIDFDWAKTFGPIIDLIAFVPKIAIPELGDSFRAMLERLREQLPPNWPERIDFGAVTTVIQDDGLPIVWVPRQEIVTELLAAPNREARVKVLVAHSSEVMQDCRDVLATIDNTTLANQLPLVERVVDAFEQGHVESAQALAVVVTETVVARTLGKDYKKVKQLVEFNPTNVTIGQVRIKAALAPIGPFYTAWWPSSGDPAPTALSRHVTVHQADLDHYTPGNAIVAVMLATSVLRAMQEFLES